MLETALTSQEVAEIQHYLKLGPSALPVLNSDDEDPGVFDPDVQDMPQVGH